MIWMGVGRPEDFVAPLNRFPVHNQWVTMYSNARFVADLPIQSRQKPSNQPNCGPDVMETAEIFKVPHFPLGWLPTKGWNLCMICPSVKAAPPPSGPAPDPSAALSTEATP